MKRPTEEIEALRYLLVLQEKAAEGDSSLNHLTVPAVDLHDVLAWMGALERELDYPKAAGGLSEGKVMRPVEWVILGALIVIGGIVWGGNIIRWLN